MKTFGDWLMQFETDGAAAQVATADVPEEKPAHTCEVVFVDFKTKTITDTVVVNYRF